MLRFDHLLKLQLLFWFGWILSAVLFSCLVTGWLLDCFSKKEAFSDTASHSPNRLVSSQFRSSPAFILTSALLLIVTFFSRYWLSGFMLGPWFFGDEALEACIVPFQLSQGESIWGGNTFFLVNSIYLLAYRVFGFSSAVARVTNISFFAAAVVSLYWALNRPFGKKVAWFVVGMMFLSSPFILHSIYATSITFCLLPAAIILYVLARPLTQASAALLGVALLAGLFLYPAAFLTGICLIFFHAIAFYRSWTWKTRSVSLVAFVLAGGLAYEIRLLVTGNPNWTRWGGGELSFEQIGQHSMVVLKDTFWESLSFNSLNFRAPYFDTAMFGFLVIGVGSSFIFSKSRPSMFDRKWIWISLLSFFGSVGLSALALHNPGIRRILSSVPLLFLIAGLGIKYCWQWKAFRPLVGGAIIVCFGLVALRSYAIGKRSWPLSGDSDFMRAAGRTLLQNTNSRKNVVIIAYNSDQWGGQLYRCALSLDGKLNRRFQSVIVIPRSGLSQKQDLQGEFFLLANELFSEKELEGIFGYPPASAKIRKLSKLPQHDQLLAIYDFTENSVRQHEK